MPGMSNTGFFGAGELSSVKQPESLIPKCGACGLLKKCKTPKLLYKGRGKQRVLVVLDVLSLEDDEREGVLNGSAGDAVKTAFFEHGIDVLEDCWVTHSIICAPRNGRATKDQVDYCRPNLVKLIKRLDPTVIITMGHNATRTLVAHTWKQNTGETQCFYGYTIPSQKVNAWICPTFHPNEWIGIDRSIIPLLVRKHLETAMGLCSSKPYKVVPDYKKQIVLITDPREAVKRINEYTKRVRPCAFDYETNMLKPDWKDSELVSNSICWDGKETIAYPITKQTAKATRAFVRAKHPKIASNLKFEERWTMQFLRTRVRNWCWDTMISAHVLDSQKGVASIKFQSYVLLGLASYNEHIEPFLKSPKHERKNRIRELSIEDLLMYNALDSLLEYKVAKLQMKKHGIKL